MQQLGRFYLHPFLFAAFPIVGLLAANLGEVEAADSIRALGVSVITMGIVFLVMKLVMRRWDKAAVLSSLAAILFFSYGHTYELLRQVQVGGVLIGRHRFLLAIWLLIFAAGVWLVARRESVSSSFTAILNVSILTALFLPLSQLLWASVRTAPVDKDAEYAIEVPALDNLHEDAPRPDVYYIIFDAYTRADVLREAFGYDNAPFLQSLEALGFTVAHESRSNYGVTRLSIPSSLNMDYIEALGPPLDPNAEDAAWLDRITKASVVRRTLERLGYRIVTFESAYGMTDWVDSDLYLSPRALSLSDQQAFGDLNSFEVLLFQTSLGRAAIDASTKLNAWFGTSIPDPNKQHRDRILFALDRLGRMGEVPGPKFVFAHIMAPHSPFIFTADGGIAGGGDIFTLAYTPSSAGEVNLIDGYRDQVAYLNTRILEEMERLLDGSATPPIIIIQGDHGARGVSAQDRMKILNAYYMPHGGESAIYDQISPVNTFRVIFNQYFGASLPLLPDRSNYSHWDTPFQITPIP